MTDGATLFRQRSDHADQIEPAIDDQHVAMAVRAQRLGIAVTVDAFDGLLARRIDGAMIADIGIVQAGAELLPGVAQGACSDAAGRPRSPGPL